MKKTYKLIKLYPNTLNLELGTIAKKDEDGTYTLLRPNGFNRPYNILNSHVENQEEYWAPYLFTTEDGVDIYERDSYYAVQINNNSGNYYPWKIQKITIDGFPNCISDLHIGKTIFSNTDDVVRFSSKESAQKYIDENTYKEGEWLFKQYPLSNAIFRFKSMKGDTDEFYQVFKSGEIYSGSSTYYTAIDKRVSKATPEQIEEILIAVAKNRGYDKNIKVKPLWGTCKEWKLNGQPHCYKNTKGLFYNAQEVLYMFNTAVYAAGKWAEIIKEQEMPEYVELLENVCGFKTGDVAKVVVVEDQSYVVFVPNRSSTSIHKPNVSYVKGSIKPSTKEEYDRQEKLRELQKRFLAGSTVRLINDAGMNAKYGNLATVKKCLFDKGHKYWEGGYMLDVEWDRSTGTTQQDGEYYSKDFELVETKKRHSCSRWGCNLNYI